MRTNRSYLFRAASSKGAAPPITHSRDPQTVQRVRHCIVMEASGCPLEGCCTGKLDVG